MTIWGPAGPGVHSTLAEKPARRNMASSSAKVYVSPAAVVQSMTSANMAAGTGVTRPSSGTNSTVTARPPGASAARARVRKRSAVGGSKWWR